MSAQRVCHRMHHAKARVGESHACHIFGVGHHGAGGFILTVGNGPGQVLHDRMHGPVGILVRERVGVSGKRRLDGVGQRVHAGGCGELGRHEDMKSVSFTAMLTMQLGSTMAILLWRTGSVTM